MEFSLFFCWYNNFVYWLRFVWRWQHCTIPKYYLDKSDQFALRSFSLPFLFWLIGVWYFRTVQFVSQENMSIKERNHTYQQKIRSQNVAIANALQLEAARATPALSLFNYDAMLSLKSLNLSNAWYITLLSPCDLHLWSLTKLPYVGTC